MITMGNIVSVHAHAIQSRVIMGFVTKYQAISLSGVQSVRNGADNSGFVSILMEDGRYFLDIGNIVGQMFVRALWSIIERIQQR
jgi:hypothetical protein